MFYERCLLKDQFNQGCSWKIYNELGIVNEVTNCLVGSFITKENERMNSSNVRILKNSILDSEYNARNKYYVSKIPNVIVNGRHLDNMRSDFVFESLCSSLIIKPESCYSEALFHRDDEDLSLETVVLILLLVLASNAVLFYFCKKFIRRTIQQRVESSDINNQIDTVVNSYLALRDSLSKE